MYEDEDLQEIHEDIIELNEDISILRRDLNNISASVEGTGENVTLNETTEARFKKPPLPMGNSEQVQYSGKNLFDKENASYSADNYVKNNNGEETYNAGNGYTTSFIKVKPNTNYTISGKITTNDLGGRIYFYDINKSWLSRSNSFSGINANFTFSTPADCNYIQFSYVVSAFDSNTVQVEEGSTATSYEPYVGGTASPNPDYPQEITNVTGDVEVKVQNIENFLDWNKFIDFSNWETALSSGYMTFKIDGLKVNTKYTLCRVNDDGYNILPAKYAGFNPARNNTNRFIDYAVQSSNLKSVTATTNVDGTLYIVFHMSNATQLAQYIELINNCWVIEGESFVEKEQQVFTFPLGNEKLMLGDYLADDGIHHVRGQYIMTGQEIDWFEYTQSGEYSDNLKCYFGLYIELNNSLRKMKSSVCSHFYNPNKWVIVPSLAKFGAYQDNPNTNNRYFITNIPTISDWKNWLQTQYQNGTPVILEYELQEEVIVPYTEAQQEVYNQIKQSLSYEEQTNISGFSTKVSPIFEVKAFRNMNATIENLRARIDLLNN